MRRLFLRLFFPARLRRDRINKWVHEYMKMRQSAWDEVAASIHEVERRIEELRGTPVDMSSKCGPTNSLFDEPENPDA